MTQLLFFILYIGKARKGSSNYESNDIADDDPENAKGELCRNGISFVQYLFRGNVVTSEILIPNYVYYTYNFWLH